MQSEHLRHDWCQQCLSTYISSKKININEHHTCNCKQLCSYKICVQCTFINLFVTSDPTSIKYRSMITSLHEAQSNSIFLFLTATISYSQSLIERLSFDSDYFLHIWFLYTLTSSLMDREVSYCYLQFFKSFFLVYFFQVCYVN